MGSVIRDVVQRLYAGMGKSKVTLLCPYVFHLYHTNECLLPSMKKGYWIAKALFKRNVELEEEDESEASKDSKHESLSSKEVQEIQAQKYARLKKSPHGKRSSPVAKEPMVQRKTSPLSESMEPSYKAVINHIKKI